VANQLPFCRRISLFSSMSDELSERAQKAKKIIANPVGFKVCEGCESIVLEKAVTCPNCHGYRFDGTPDRVVEQARILGSRAATSLSPKDFE
jgi:uncharacterized protein YlaI